MAWNTGSFSTANAGELITLLDTYLSGVGNWTTHDASAGTNCKVYKCYDADGPCLFYLKVDDNYSAYAKVELWEDWDEVSHAGVGRSASYYSSASYYFAIARAAGAWKIGVHDNYFVFMNSTTAGYFIGRPNLFDESKNIVMCCVHTGSTRTGYNPISYWQTSSANSACWGFLFDENGNNSFARGLGGANYTQNGGCKDTLGNFHIWESFIINQSSGLIVGTLPGICVLGDYLHGLAEGDTVTISSQAWVASIESYYALVRAD